jgi:hypothetical protein
MQELKPIDLDKNQPYNYTEILNKTDEFIEMLLQLDIAYPVFSQKIKHLRELKYLYNLVRERHPKLFTY